MSQFYSKKFNVATYLGWLSCFFIVLMTIGLWVVISIGMSWDYNIFLGYQAIDDAAFTGTYNIGIGANAAFATANPDSAIFISPFIQGSYKFGSGNIKFGDTTNYTQIDSSGIRFYGSHTVWDDLKVPLMNARPGDTPAGEVAYKSSQLYSFAEGENVYFVVQLPHKYKLGSDIGCHIHYILAEGNDGDTDEKIRFDVTYSWAYINGEFPAATTISTGEVDVSAKVDDTHYLAEMTTDLDEDNAGGSDGVSSMILCSLTRIGGLTDDYAHEVMVTEIDFHIEIDGLGSKTEYVK